MAALGKGFSNPGSWSASQEPLQHTAEEADRQTDKGGFVKHGEQHLQEDTILLHFWPILYTLLLQAGQPGIDFTNQPCSKLI